MQAREIKRIRLQQGLTQVEIARVLGLDPGTVSRMENAPEGRKMRKQTQEQLRLRYGKL